MRVNGRRHTSGRKQGKSGFELLPRATAVVPFATKTNERPVLQPGETVTTITGQTFRPVVDEDGCPLIRPTRRGDHFLALSRDPRVLQCHGSPIFLGLTRQIVEPVQEGEN